MPEVKITKETEIVAEKLKKISNERGLSASKIAQMTGVSKQLIQAIIARQRNVTLGMLVNLSRVLDVSTDYLLGLSDTDNTEELENLEKKLTDLDNKIRETLINAANTNNEQERRELLDSISGMQNELIFIKRKIEQARKGLLKVKNLTGQTTLYLPAEYVRATSAVEKDGDIYYIDKNQQNAPLVAVRSKSGEVSITDREKAQEGEIIGGVTYILQKQKAEGQ